MKASSRGATLFYRYVKFWVKNFAGTKLEFGAVYLGLILFCSTLKQQRYIMCS